MLLMVVLWFRVLKMNFDPHVTANETISGFKRIFTLIRKELWSNPNGMKWNETECKKHMIHNVRFYLERNQKKTQQRRKKTFLKDKIISNQLWETHFVKICPKSEATDSHLAGILQKNSIFTIKYHINIYNPMRHVCCLFI